jgi:hypothetical protein
MSKQIKEEREKDKAKAATSDSKKNQTDQKSVAKSKSKEPQKGDGSAKGSGRAGAECLYVDYANISPWKGLSNNSLPYDQKALFALDKLNGGSASDYVRHFVEKNWYFVLDDGADANSMGAVFVPGSINHRDERGGTVHNGPGIYYAGPMSGLMGTRPWKWAHFFFQFLGPAEETERAYQKLPSLYSREELIKIKPDLQPWADAPTIVGGNVDTTFTRLAWAQQISRIFNQGGGIHFNSEQEHQVPGLVKYCTRNTFYDGTFSYTKPIKMNGIASAMATGKSAGRGGPALIDSAQASFSTAQANIAESEALYNFFIPSYEEEISKEYVKEVWLPNLHAFWSEKLSQNLDVDKSLFDKLIKMGYLLTDVFTDVLDESGQKIGESDKGAYFEKYAGKLNALGAQFQGHNIEIWAELWLRYFSIVFPATDLEELLEANDKEVTFPMSIKLRFGTDGPGRFSNLLSSTDLLSLLIAEIIKDNEHPLWSANPTLPSSPTADQRVSHKVAQQLQNHMRDLDNAGVANKSNFHGANYVHEKQHLSEEVKYSTGVRRLDLTRWWEEYMPLKVDGDDGMLTVDSTSDFAQEVRTGLAAFLGSNSEKDAMAYGDSSSGVLLAAVLALFGGGLENIMRNVTRSYREVLDGKLAHSETLCYRIEKYGGGRAPIQNIYFAKSQESDFLEFVDTQIKYNKGYTYKVYAYQAVFGTEYTYGDFSMTGVPDIERPDLPIPQKAKPCNDEHYKSWYMTNFPQQQPPIFEDYAAQASYIDEFNCDSPTRKGTKWTGYGDVDKGYGTSPKKKINTGKDDLDLRAHVKHGDNKKNEGKDLSAQKNVLRRHGSDTSSSKNGETKRGQDDKKSLKAKMAGTKDPYLGQVANAITREFDPADLKNNPNREILGGTPKDRATPEVFDEPLAGEIYVMSRPWVQLVEVPYTEFENIKVLDYPPMPPEVKIYPYYSINNKIQIHLNMGYGEIKDTPIPIEDGDELCFKAMAEHQRNNDPQLDLFLQRDDGRYYLKFTADDYMAGYDIYRLEKKPTSYSDFKGNLLRRLSCDINPDTSGVTQYLLYDDTVEPNKKYYYTFRSIDIHGNISNPTFVYEVEMVDDGGAIYQKIDIIEFEEEKVYQPSRSAKRFVQIQPSLLQSTLNMTPGQLGQVAIAKSTSATKSASAKKGGGKTVSAKDPDLLGIQDAPVWNQDFKIRFTSIDTGRKFDLNLDCSYKFMASDLLNSIENNVALSKKGVKTSTLNDAQLVAKALAQSCSDPKPGKLKSAIDPKGAGTGTINETIGKDSDTIAQADPYVQHSGDAKNGDSNSQLRSLADSKNGNGGKY